MPSVLSLELAFHFFSSLLPFKSYLPALWVGQTINNLLSFFPSSRLTHCYPCLSNQEQEMSGPCTLLSPPQREWFVFKTEQAKERLIFKTDRVKNSGWVDLLQTASLPQGLKDVENCV